jgi:hypothetical protein
MLSELGLVNRANEIKGGVEGYASKGTLKKSILIDKHSSTPTPAMMSF